MAAKNIKKTKNTKKTKPGKAKSEQKKVKLKVKTSEKTTPKLKKTVTPEKTIDERVIDVSFEEDVKPKETAKPEPQVGLDERIDYLTGVGTQHPVQEMIQKLRNILINSGFNEMENSFFIAENDIYKQYNIKSSILLSKLYYLAENQPQPIELNKDHIQELDNLKQDITINIDKLKDILKDYNDKKINNYQIFERIIEDLALSHKDINRLLEVVPQLKKFEPKLTNITLRSSMAPTWLSTLAAIMDKENLPLKVFSTGIWFKREPKLNELNLRSHYGTSCVIMNEKISLDNGKVIAEEILNRLGFEDLEFKEVERKKNFNIYFIKELEIYSNEIKIASCGIFSKKILKKYGIDTSVLYLNFGLEHMVMVQKGIDDIRELMFPQFYKAWKLNDKEIVNSIQFINEPKTELGNEIASEIVKTCLDNCNVISPCEFIAFDKPIDLTPGQSPVLEVITNNDKNEHYDSKQRLIVKVFKGEKDSKLCGPATFNEIVIKDGDVYGLQNIDQNPELADAEKTNITYLDAFAKYIGFEIENKLKEENNPDAISKTSEINAGIIKDMEDINLQLDGRAFRYILTNNKKIDVRGPMFINVEYKVIKNNKKKEKKKLKKSKEFKLNKANLKDSN